MSHPPDSSSVDPYSVGEVTDNHLLAQQPRTFWGSVLVFTRVTLVSVAWMVIYFFVSALVLGFLTGIYFSFRYSRSNPPADTSVWISVAWMITPQVIGGVGFVLG